MKQNSHTNKNQASSGDDLTAEECRVLLEGGTEEPFSGKYLNETRKGVYVCKSCGNALFSSDVKFASNVPGLQGWPSFDDAIPGSVVFEEDKTMGMNRTEVRCTKCNAHLGHVFDEETETKTGKHYCINSVCLDLKSED